MSSEWPLRTLDELADEVTVGYVGPMASQYVESGVPFLRSLNIEPFGVNTTDLKFVSSEFHQRIRKSSLRPGDVAIVRTGKPGTCAVVPEWLPDANCSDLVIVRCGSSLRPHFLCYWVNSIASHHIDSHTVGAVQQHFNVGAAKTMKVAVPNLRDQDAVVAVLGSLDDRITLLRETNATLETIAQALFKSWFVDFDPVHAKSQGLAPAGMDEATAALFPDGFEESALGPLPRGWRAGSILEIADLLSGGTPKTDRSEFWGGEIAWASAKDVSQSTGSVLVSTERSITTEGLERSATRLIPRLATVVVARGATTGRMVMFGREMAMNQTCYGLASKLGAPVALYCLLRREIDVLVNSAHGSVFDTITTSTFARSIVVHPPVELLARFESAAGPLFERIAESTERIQTLTALRDTLLPRLISGQLRLPEAEIGTAESL